MLKKIKSALVSVYHKDNLEKIVKMLAEENVEIFSTGGTRDFIEKLGVKVTAVEDLTSYPSILGGRVKTLHPKIFGGILARRENKNDLDQLAEYMIPEIDLVIVDLYPFEDTVASGAPEPEIIEKIDIGGISLIRAGAKNFNDVLIVSSRNQYEFLIDILQRNKCASTLDDRRKFALEAFNNTSSYDTAIYKYFAGQNEIAFKENFTTKKELRYGENPHQKGSFFGNFDEVFEQLHGKEISYNNLLDIEAAVNLISEFSDPAFAILKHNNACGLSSGPDLLKCWHEALAADPVSAFGGILITNRNIEKHVAEEVNKLFCEVVIAPAYSRESLDTLMQKKNRIILVQKKTVFPARQFRSLLNGVLVQDRDLKSETKDELKTATKLAPSEKEISDLLFAARICKHTKSNTIVLAKNNQLLASGVGQTSRVDALKQAIEKAHSFGFDLKGAVMASDAFFPFPDCVEIAYNAGITAVIQPGGSVKDQDSIDFCDRHGISMVFTGIRHFKH